MAIIEHDLVPKQKSRKSNLKVKVDLYAYASELFNELSAIGIFKRLKDVPQLGLIKVPKKLMKSRFDYTAFAIILSSADKKRTTHKARTDI